MLLPTLLRLSLLHLTSASFLSLFNLGSLAPRAPAPPPPPRQQRRSLDISHVARQGLSLFSYFTNIKRDVVAPPARRSAPNLLGQLGSSLPSVDFLPGVPIVPGVSGSIPGAGDCFPRGMPFISRNSPSFFQNLLRTFPGTQDILRSLQTYPKHLDPRKLIGKWHWVLLTPSVHTRYCATTEVNAVSVFNSTYASFGTVDHYREAAPNGPPKISFGYGIKTGTKTSFYSQADPCPYEAVLVGPESTTKSRQYEWVVLSNWAKFPLIGLARDLDAFEREHKDAMREELRRRGYINFLTESLGSVQFADWGGCGHQAKGNFFGKLLNGLFG